MIKIIDYGVGNIQAFLTLFKRIGILAERARSPKDLETASRLILPGVGHFDHAMRRLNDSGMRETLDRKVLRGETPIMGVCVGMQMLASSSEEGNLAGLNWIPGKIRSFGSLSCFNLPMPHMGWNQMRAEPHSQLFQRGFDETSQFYFLHSYYFDADDKKDVAAKAFYGIEFEAGVSRGNVHGVQCHPEKSHNWGANLIRNFAQSEKC
ncbi:imidazole glycerol phosphate synthase subunit HisH [Alphaproteobacteria bacterium]|nr:imidazole glycerol phosphate synthase subunit HisH [Alphaproteobacteria bacterium]